MIVFLASCDKEAFEENSSVPAAGAPTLTVTILSNTDSTLTVSYNMSVAGRVTLAVIPTAVDTPAIADLEARAFEGATYIEYFIHDTGNAHDTITYSGLLPNTSYRLFGIGHNTDGVVSTLVITDAVVTQDFANPVISSFSPAKGDEDISITEDIVLTFHEPVTYVSTKSIRLFSDYAAYDELIPAENISVVGNVVTISHSDWPYDDYINLEMEEGTFVDENGNPSAAYLYYPASPNYWFSTAPEIYFDKITGHYYVTSENEIGFGYGESGGYWVDIEQTDYYEISIYNLSFNGATLVLTLDPSDHSIVVAEQSTGVVHPSSGEDIMASDTDPFGVGESTGIVPGSYDEETGKLIFYTYYYISLGQFGFFTYELDMAIPPKGVVTGPKDSNFTFKQYN